LSQAKKNPNEMMMDKKEEEDEEEKELSRIENCYYQVIYPLADLFSYKCFAIVYCISRVLSTLNRVRWLPCPLVPAFGA
jgi:hypothetical protein